MKSKKKAKRKKLACAQLAFTRAALNPQKVLCFFFASFLRLIRALQSIRGFLFFYALDTNRESVRRSKQNRLTKPERFPNECVDCFEADPCASIRAVAEVGYVS